MNFIQNLKLNVPKFNFLKLGVLGSTIGGIVGVYLLVMLFLTWWWDKETDPFDSVEMATADAEARGLTLVKGYSFAYTNRQLASSLLNKRGGFLSNDVFPPGVWMDNIPAWEFGVLVMVRDTARALRVDLARTQSQSNEEPNLAEAEGKFFYDNSSWIFPASESEYQAGIEYLDKYLLNIANPNNPDAQFYPRADNLQRWLRGVSARLGDISQRLSESVGKRQRELAAFGERNPDQSTPVPSERETKTPWTQIDDVFYEARGQAWALLHLLKAVEHDFQAVLEDKNALPMLQQIIRDLEATQETIWSPVILNGGGFGFLANHSLVMASYISRVNAAIIEIEQLLEQG